MWPPYQPSPTIYIERGLRVEENPCKWYEDLEGDYCKAPAMWLVFAGIGAGMLWMVSRKR